MNKEESLQQTVAQFLQTDPASLAPDTPLRGPRMGGSVARYALDAAIRRTVGVKCRAVYTAKTYGALEAAVLGKETPEDRDEALLGGAVRFAPFGAGDGNAVACGIDLERVKNLPEADDYWTHAFYQAHFTKAEIAYCLTREQPRVHFAARWCAKEALKKCDAAFLQEDMNRLEVAQDEDGRVKLQYRREEGEPIELPHALSLSHTPDAAVAAVVRVRETAPAETPNGPSPPSGFGAEESTGRGSDHVGAAGKLAVLLALMALLLAAAAVITALLV